MFTHGNPHAISHWKVPFGPSILLSVRTLDLISGHHSSCGRTLPGDDIRPYVKVSGSRLQQVPTPEISYTPAGDAVNRRIGAGH